MKKKGFKGFYLFGLLMAIFALSQAVLAQKTSVSVNNGDDESYLWWYIALFVLVFCLIIAVVWWYRGKQEAQKKIALSASKRENNNWETGSLDADREMEWLRKNQLLVDKKRKRELAKKKMAKEAEKIKETPSPVNKKTLVSTVPAVLPVFTFEKLKPANEFSPLIISKDEALISAIEQVHDEYEEDEAVRDLALRVLMAFKTRNSIEALSQIALYDLSSTIRSKAVVTLTEFDHESVFETILLACADPTREVRAAAARGLTRLSFDRADAWARIMETREPGRIRQAARAAIESGFVERSFDRLVHSDKQTAYEAFVLLAMLLRADESEQIFNALRTHKNMKVRQAILHLFKVTKDQNALNELYTMLEDKMLPQEIKIGVDKTIEEIGLALV